MKKYIVEIIYIDNIQKTITFELNQDMLYDSYKKYIKSNDITKSELNQVLASTANISEESVRKHITGKNFPNDINIVYAYGNLLEGNRYAFLTLVENDQFESSQSHQSVISLNDFVNGYIQAIKAGIVNIIAEYASSKCFNTKKVTDTDILEYYRKKIDTIEIIIAQIHGHQEIVEKLLDITTAVKRFICSSELPGVPESWFAVNPNLRYYSAEFDLAKHHKPAYLIAERNNMIAYKPKEDELVSYMKYFNDLKEANNRYNYHYDDNDYYQHELIKTVKLLFEQL